MPFAYDHSEHAERDREKKDIRDAWRALDEEKERLQLRLDEIAWEKGELRAEALALRMNVEEF